MPSEDVHGDPLTILLVEDNLPHAELVKRSLEAHEIANKIYHVSDGEAALAYLFRQGVYADPATSPRPHVVLLDLHLPKVSGLDVLREIKTSNDLRTIPVVILDHLDSGTGCRQCLCAARQQLSGQTSRLCYIHATNA